MIIYLY